MKYLGAFFATARERYKILLSRRAGKSRPWTTNDIFLDNRFCNVRREDDKTTQWFRAKVRNTREDLDSVFMATVAFRWFNRIETGEALLPVLLSKTGWQSKRARKIVSKLSPVFTGAFMIYSEPGKLKWESVCDAIDTIYKDRFKLIDCIADGTLEFAHSQIVQYPMMGNFMAYEVVTDLRHTWLLNKAKDINTWCSPGPGCARGASRVMHGELGHYNYGSAKSRAEVVEICQIILAHSHSDGYWPKNWPRWEMREVEHWLCEFDKYQRIRNGEGKMKGKFKGRAELDYSS